MAPAQPHLFPHSVVSPSLQTFLLRLPPGLSTKGRLLPGDMGLKSGAGCLPFHSCGAVSLPGARVGGRDGAGLLGYEGPGGASAFKPAFQRTLLAFLPLLTQREGKEKMVPAGGAASW